MTAVQAGTPGEPGGVPLEVPTEDRDEPMKPGAERANQSNAEEGN